VALLALVCGCGLRRRVVCECVCVCVCVCSVPMLCECVSHISHLYMVSFCRSDVLVFCLSQRGVVCSRPRSSGQPREHHELVFWWGSLLTRQALSSGQQRQN